MSAADTSERRVFQARLDTPEQLEKVLGLFEDRFEEDHGERLTSGQFYERYTHGEHDTPIGVAWATYFEAYLALTERTRDLARLVPPRVLVTC